MKKTSKLPAARLCAAACLLVGLTLSCSTLNAEAIWRPLFNGKNLDGWYTYLEKQDRDHDPDRLIQVHDGVVHGYKDSAAGSEQPQGYICTRDEFSHYRLRFQYMWGGKEFAPRAEGIRDAGVLFHVVGDDGRAFGVWPTSVECQVQEGDTGDLIAVNTRCTSWIDEVKGKDDRGYPTFHVADGGKEIRNTWYVNASEVCDRREGWNDVEIQVNGAKSAVYIVNGKVNQRLADIEQPDGDGWKPLDKGRIVFQFESAEVCYRNIEIMELPPDDGDPNPAVQDHREPVTAEVDNSSTPEASGPVGVDAIKIPEGFEVSVAAAPPLLLHPMMACLDDRGRLFVAESDGVNRESVDDILKTRPHKILMLEDVDGDGVFDKQTVFAEGLVQPNGAQWYDGALYVCSAPYVWRFRDTDGDGKADEQVRVVGKFGFDGMSSAFHGPVLGPDGRMYWSGGQHGWKLDQALHESWANAPSGAGGPDADLKIGWTRWTPGAFSSWPDGSEPENIGFGGIANPVETAFTEEGNVIGTISLFDYLDNQRRDVVVEWTDGAVYSMKDFNYTGLVRTGEDLTPVSYVGHVAPSGIMRFRDDQFGREYRDNFLFAEFNTHKVCRLRLQREGSALTSHDEPFLASTDPDSHFTDVMQDADGSLLVLNTGGWFLHGCPTSQIAKPSIYGAVYRIRRTGAPAIDDPRGLRLAWSDATAGDLATRLDDGRFAVRDRAVEELAKRGDNAIAVLRETLQSGSPQARLNAIWAVTRMPDGKAREVARVALDDSDLTVRLAAIHSVGLRRDALGGPKLIERLASESPAERRAAATALGRLKAKAAVKPLLAAMAPGADRFLEHAIIYALTSISDDAAMVAGLGDSSPAVQRAALIALDQVHSPLLTRNALTALLNSSDAQLQDAAFGVARSRPEWADEMVSRIAEWIAKDSLSPQEEVALRGFVRAFWENGKTQSLVATAVRDEKTNESTRVLLLQGIATVEADALPAAWVEAVGACLDSSPPTVVSQAISVVSERSLSQFDDRLAQIAISKDRPDDQRLAAAAAAVRHLRDLPDELVAFLLGNCNEEAPSVDRLAASQAIRYGHFTLSQLGTLADFVAKAGAIELPAFLTQFEGRSETELGTHLVKALGSSPGFASLTSERVDNLFHSYPPEVQRLAQPLVDRLKKEGASQSERLQQLSVAMGKGDPESGRQVFFSSRAACSSCHQIGDQGGHVGPNLSTIGQIRSQRDLMEAIVFPSASFVRGFEPYLVVTSEGQTLVGVLSRQTRQAIFLRTADGKEIRIDRDDIEQLQPGTVSIMPQGLDKVLNPQELGDVIAFLQTLK